MDHRNRCFIDVLPIKMVIFNSYVSLPEGRSRMLVLGGHLEWVDQILRASDYMRLLFRILFHRTQLLFGLKTTVCLVFRHNLTMLDHCASKYLLKISRISQSVGREHQIFVALRLCGTPFIIIHPGYPCCKDLAWQPHREVP